MHTVIDISENTPQAIHLAPISAEAMSALFVEMDIRNNEKTSGVFCVSTLDILRFTQAEICGGALKLLRLPQHLCRLSDKSYFICLNLSQSHEIGLSQNGRESSLTRGDLALLDTNAPFALEIPDRANVICTSVPRVPLERRMFALDDLVGSRISGAHGLGLVAAQMLAASASAANGLSHERSAMLANTALDLFTAAATDQTAWPEDRNAYGNSWSRQQTLRRAQAFIDAYLGCEALSPEVIARAIGISRRYLHSLFAGEGCTPMGWVLRRRLMRCRQMIEEQAPSPRRVSDIAFENGFTNVSSFNRAFKAEFGVSPTQYRTLRHG